MRYIYFAILLFPFCRCSVQARPRQWRDAVGRVADALEKGRKAPRGIARRRGDYQAIERAGMHELLIF